MDGKDTMNEQMRYFLIFAAVLFIGSFAGVFAVAVFAGVNAPSWQYAAGSAGGALLMFSAWQFLKFKSR